VMAISSSFVQIPWSSEYAQPPSLKVEGMGVGLDLPTTA
jgi:hypothetical protein